MTCVQRSPARVLEEYITTVHRINSYFHILLLSRQSSSIEFIHTPTQDLEIIEIKITQYKLISVIFSFGL